MSEDTTQSEIHKIQQAAREASARIAQDAAEAKTVIANAAASAINTLSMTSALQAKDIEYIKQSVASLLVMMDKLDAKYVTKSDFAAQIVESKDHEVRLRAIEKSVYWAMGGLAIFNLVVATGVPILLFFIKK